jgi:integrase
MNFSLKLTLFKGKKHADGTHPIQLQLHVTGEAPQRKGLYKCQEADWDAGKKRLKTKVRNAAFVNNHLSEEYTKYERKLLQVLTGEISHNNFFGTKKDRLNLDDVLGFEMERFIAENKPGAYKRVQGYRIDLAAHFKSEKTYIDNIGLEWFEQLASFLSKEIKVGNKVVKKKNIGSTVQSKIKALRQMISRYRKTSFDKEVDNFRVSQVKAKKGKLTALEIKVLEDMELPLGSTFDVCRDVFLMQIYLRGARVGSILQAYSHQFENGRYLEINQAGQKTNVGCKLIPKAQAIVNKYYGKNERLFPLFSFEPDPKCTDFENKRKQIKRKESVTAIINKHIKIIGEKAGITKILSSHIARHSFARMAIDKINNPMITMDLLGHSSLAVHQMYLNDIRKDDELDKAADDIFG